MNVPGRGYDFKGRGPWLFLRGMSLLALYFFFYDYRVMIVSPRADHPFHVSQLFVILDRIELLLDVFATGLEEGTVTLYISSV
jgi:hypothetical protein